MSMLIPAAYSSTPWWQVEGEGLVPQAQRGFAPKEKLDAIIAARRANCSARMKALRSRSERGIARLHKQNGR